MHAIRESIALFAALAPCLSSCGGGSNATAPATPPPPPPPANTVLQRGDSPPGIHVSIVEIHGASGSDGTFRTGDSVRVRFTLTKDDGSRWGIGEMLRSSALISGPSFNYQRVIAEQTDAIAASVEQSDGSFVYAFTPKIPSVYLAPYNDTQSFGALENELTGQTLLAGTYTVGLSFGWDYTVGAKTFHDVGEGTIDFLFGGETLLAHREVTKQSNCEQCHTHVEAHDGERRAVTMCVLCHTAGAEDANDPALAGGTPNTSVDMRIMIHKIHNARHLPSVNGVGVDANGQMIYTATPKPYVLADSVTGVHDYSANGQTVFPNRVIPLPHDLGFKNLPANQQAIQDVVHTGLDTCEVCHGDPDGAGPLTAPAQGTLVYAQPARHTCGACHDQVDFDKPFVLNGQTMDPQPDNSLCVTCHQVDGGGFYSPLAVKDGHLHPLKAPAYTGTTFPDFTPFPGLQLDLTNVAEGPGSNGNGKLDPGEKVELTLAIVDDQGASYPQARIDGLNVLVAGPSWNSNLLCESAIPIAGLPGSSPYTIEVPELDQLEFVGRSSASLGDVFHTAKSPHWNVAGALTSVFVRTATTGASSTLSAAARAPQNFVDLADASSFARDDVVVIDDGVAGKEEYLRVQFVDGDRLWFSSPASPAYKASTSFNHGASATVRGVVLATQHAGTDFSLDVATGTITELAEFGANAAVLVTYTTDFRMPSEYPVPENDSPTIDDSFGEWRGKSLVAGTYRVEVTAYADLDLNAEGEDNLYRFATPASERDVLVGSATTLEPYSLVSSGSNCLACHQDLVYHGGTWRGFDACITCHANAGAEDRPRYVSANAPATNGVTVNFRTLLHQIHRGSQLDKAATFELATAGGTTYPNDFAVKKYSQYLYPALPDRTAQCAKCHGATNTSWLLPADRAHPTEQSSPVLAWRAACATCHDLDSDFAHFDVQTSPTNGESCALCHAPGATWEVATEHANR